MNGETVVTVQWGGACIAVLDRHVSTIIFIGQNPALPVEKVCNYWGLSTFFEG
jgi:hypothetical protein